MGSGIAICASSWQLQPAYWFDAGLACQANACVRAYEQACHRSHPIRHALGPRGNELEVEPRASQVEVIAKLQQPIIYDFYLFICLFIYIFR